MAPVLSLLVIMPVVCEADCDWLFDNLTFKKWIMARYENLPIFKRAMELTVKVEKVVRQFSRYNKYTLGAELRGQCHEVLALIAEVNSQRNKVEGLERLRLLLERIKIHVMLLREVRGFPGRESFFQITELAVDVSRQNEGWLRSVKSVDKKSSKKVPCRPESPS